MRDWAEQDGLEVRIAVNTGEAIVELEARPGHGEAMVAGDVVNTAARLQTAAPVGAVLVGEETYAATRNVFEYRPAQPVLAKGKSAPVRAWLAVRATSQAGERPMAPVRMIGRDRELAVLTSIWERVVEEGRAKFVTVFGPAGIGKSRLALELAQLVADRGARVVRGRSTPYGASTPYSAFAQVIKQVAVIFDSDEPGGRTCEARDGGRTARRSGRCGGARTASRALPRPRRWSGARPIARRSSSQPASSSRRSRCDGATMLLFEDIHWADSSQLELLEALASRVRDVPVLFVALARPELLTERPTWGGGLPAYTALPLDPLTESASRELADQLLAESGSEGAAAVVETAEGNPLFIQELAASIAERSTAGELPGSVRAIIAARLDSLPSAERSLLVDASVAGRVFWRGALAEMGARGELGSILGSLEDRGLIEREAVSRIKGDQQFAFAHGLIHDVAYQTLPRAARRERHAAVARFLEETTVTGQSHEALAHHWREAGETSRAVDELIAAAAQAARGWAKEHAIALYKQALELVSVDDPRRQAIRLQQIVTAQAIQHFIQGDVSGRPPPD